MSDSEENAEAKVDLPEAAVRKSRWSFPMIWVVPLVAAVVAGYLIFERSRAYGPTVTVVFKDADGIRAGETWIQHLGVPIGQVTAVELADDLDHAIVTARLARARVSVAREGSVFWIVRPELGLGNISGLGTVISGPHIEVLPGTGAEKKEFVGLETSPVILERGGLKIVLVTNRAGSLRPSSPVHYRGVEVGVVQATQLSSDAKVVNVNVFIRQRYAGLVRTGSKFWNVSGVDFNAGLFRGVELKIESLRSVVAGGVEFATPDDPESKPVRNGMAFPLYSEAKKEWLDWSPKLNVPPER
jgi:paraquat-inducible protein B